MVWYLKEILKNFVFIKLNFKYIVFKEDKLWEDFFYWLMVDVELLDGMCGWVVYWLKMVVIFFGGVCNGSQMQKEVFGIIFYIICIGWYDENKFFVYEFF